MFYQFPTINNIDDVLPHVDDNFIIANKGEYTVINYILPDKLTFPSVNDLRSAIRRECRGIIFCSESGNILRRGYHKFFNSGEREDISEDIVSFHMTNEKFSVLSKLDGSMIIPFKVNSGELIWGTKMGKTHITPRVSSFVSRNLNYIDFFNDIDSKGFSPIFEWYSPEDRIVVDYGDKECLWLTAIRNKYDGMYSSYDDLLDVHDKWSIPIVNTHYIDLKAIKHQQSTNTVDEGYVIRFDTGHMVKIKHDHYCKVHRAKSSLSKERHITDLILTEKIDDLKPFLDQDDLTKLENFEVSLHERINQMVTIAESNFINMKQSSITRKDLAINYINVTPKWLMDLLFKLFTDVEFDDLYARSYIKQLILKHSCRDSKYQEFCIDDILKDVVRWKPVMFSGDV